MSTILFANINVALFVSYILKHKQNVMISCLANAYFGN